MAGFIQNMIQNKIQNVAQGAAMYAITTGGRVVGDVVISAGDLIESSGRHVGDSIEGYIDRYGNWIRTYGNGVMAATAASAPPNGSRPVFQTKPFPTKDFPTDALKALPAPNKPNVRALQAPGRKNGTNKKPRSQLKRANSDTKAIEAPAPKNGLPSSGVKKALPAPRTATNAAQGLSKGQLAKLQGIKRNEENEKKKTASPTAALPSPANGVAPIKPTATKKPRKAAGGDGPGKVNTVKPPSDAAKSVVGDNNKAAAKNGGGEANKENTGPTAPKPMYNPNNDNKPVPFSVRTPEGKVKMSAASRPKKATAGLTNGVGAGAKKGAGAVGGAAKAVTGTVNKGAGAAKGGYNFLAQQGGPPKSESGGVDFMKMYSPQLKKGAGSVKGGGNAANAGKAAGDGAKGGAEERAQSLKFDFF